LSTDASPKTDDTPWALVQRSLEAKQPFRELLPTFAAMGLTGEDVGVLLNDPTSQLRAWLEEPVEREAVVLHAVVLHAVDPPPGEPLVPARRFGSRGLLGWLTGANKIEGLGLFTEADVFESHGVQFAVMPEPVRPVVFGEVVPLRVLALNCLSVPVHFGVTLEAQPGLLQSPRRYSLSLNPGAASLALLPLRLCTTERSVVRVVPLFEADELSLTPRLRFAARPYARPLDAALGALIGLSVVAAAAGLSPVYAVRNGPATQGSPDSVGFRPDPAAAMRTMNAESHLWRLTTF
jgi:hypothetical protein